MNKLNWGRMLGFLIAGLLLVIPDQLTKMLAVSRLQGQPAVPIIPHVLELLYVENRGAAFGILNGKQWVFYVITAVVLLFILLFIGILPKEKKYLPAGLVCLLIFSGAIGNFIDRARQAYVVDFIYFMPIDFPVFNVADIFVTCGCLFMVVLFLFVYKDEDFAFMKESCPWQKRS